ncbi:hypothetical protein WJX72_000444 [[Myrmecia] bisecta]|uniref:Polysaccharide deacetylase n=1 Tax=[Myrmecia] bisecta TaxID=41462 RepID=A0AAW1QNP8_9CHLO
MNQQAIRVLELKQGYLFQKRSQRRLRVTVGPSMAVATHGRYEYSAINTRPTYEWPNGSKLAVYIALNIEQFPFGEGLQHTLAHEAPHPDVANYGWRDYGNRVGVWRLLDLFDELQLPVSVLLNSTVYEHCPGLAEAFIKRGDEIVGHGRTNGEKQGVLSEDEERALIEEATMAHPKRPQGWLGPWLSQSFVTPDLLQDAGYTYVLDWCLDDQPVWMKTRNGGILAIPYASEINDIPAIVVRREAHINFADMIVDNFDEQLEQSRKGAPLVMAISLHPFIVGQPFRLRHLRRALQHICASRDKIWFTTAGAIAEHAAGLPKGTLPGDA